MMRTKGVRGQIDAHCHIGSGREKVSVGWRMQQTVDELLREMDRCGVDRAVVCPVEPYIVVYNREGNDFIADAVRAHPDRLIGFATVNPWYGEEGVAELERAVERGLVGLKVHSSLQGFFIHDALIYPLMEKVQELGLLTYFHTTTPIYAMPFQLADLAEQFPQVPFILGHMGFADGWTDVVAATEKLTNVYLDTSLTGPMVIAEAMAKVGPKRIVFGSNAPVSSLEAELYKIEVMSLPSEAKRLILGENMARMLKACGV